MKLDNNIRKLRFQTGELTQAELAKGIGVTRQTIISLEKGKYIPSTLLALKMANFFEVIVEDIFFIVEEQHETERSDINEKE
ncbi:MAG: helix-turn-helix transcriptional regulator [Fidelibacterota bacterium]